MKIFLRASLSIVVFLTSIYFGYSQTITPTGPLAALSTTYGTASSETSFTFIAAALPSNQVVTITPPAGFELSLTTGGTFSASLTVSADGTGAIPSTSVFVRLSATANFAGSPYSGSISLSGGATASIATVASTVGKKALTITGINANKDYDGNTTATLTGAALSGIVGSDVVTLDGTGVTASFADANAGAGKAVTLTGSYTISGTDAANYSITQPTGITATIAPKSLTITGATVSNKEYDGNDTATLGGTPTLNGIVGSEDVTLAALPTATFSDKNQGTVKVVTSAYALSGTAVLTNYSLTQPTLAANISQKPLTITGITANNKGFDGTTTATLSGTPSFVGVISPDIATVGGTPLATFASSGPGVGITVNVTGYTVSNSNYTVTQPTLSANISANTTIAQITGGVAVGPTINTSVTKTALLGFSVNNASNTSDFTALTLTATSDPSLLFSSIKLISSADNTYDGGDLAVATATTTSTTITFSALSPTQTITGGATVYYYFVEATLKPFFNSVDPTIKISFNPTTDITFSGGVVSTSSSISTINGANSAYTFHDNIQPTIVSVTNSVDPIFQSALTQTVVVKFSETMKTTGFNPTITLSQGTWGAQSVGSWSTTTNTNDTYTATFAHAATPEETFAGVTSSISVATPQDISGNVISNTLTSSGFLLDNKRPVATVTTSILTPPILTSITQNNLTKLRIQVAYDEQMNTAVNPTLTVSGSTQFNPLPTGTWSGGNTYTVDATHNGTQEEVPSVVVTAAGGKDVVGNTQLTSPNSNSFVIDTKRPTVVSSNRLLPLASTPTKVTSVTFQVIFSENVTNVGVDASDFSVIPSGTATFTAKSATSVDAKTYNVTLTGVSGDGTLRLDILNTATINDVATNAYTANFNTGEIFTIDNTAPVVGSIASNTTLKGIGSSQGIVATSVDFLVTFTEANTTVTGVDATDFNISKDATVNFTPPLVVTGSGNTRIVTVNGITGTGKISLLVNDDDTILDAAGNPLGGSGAGNGSVAASFTSNKYYTIALPAPTNPVAALTAPTITNNSVNVQWNQPGAGSQAATHYLVMARLTSGGSYPSAIADGTYVADGAFAKNIVKGAGSQNVTFTSLNSGSSYDFIIYPYTLGTNNTNDNIDFNVTTPATVSAITTLSSVSKLTLTSGGGILPSVISSPGQAVIKFVIQDDGTNIGADPLGDNAPFKFSSIVFKVGGTNNITKWTEVIGGAQLIEGSTAVTATVAITDTDITISGIASTNSADPGFISDDGSKQYTLNVWFKSNLAGSQNYPAIIDGLKFDFRVNNTSLVYDNTSNAQKSSNLIGGSTIDSGTNTVAVVASKLVFDPIPQATIGVGSTFPIAKAPVVRALDANNNWDLGYNKAFTITNSLGLTQVPGVATFPLGGFLTLNNYQLSEPGATILTVTENGGSPTTTPAVAPSTITGVVSPLAQITGPITLVPTTIPVLTTSLGGAVKNFDFTITDDQGADATNFTNNDALPTRINTFKINIATTAAITDWTKVLAGAELSNGSKTSTATISATQLVFSAATAVTTDLGFIADGGNKTYQLKVWFKSTIDPTVTDLVDNNNIVFTISDGLLVTDGPVSSASTSSTPQTSSASSGNTNNRIVVVGTQFKFTTQPSAAQFYDAPGTSATIPATVPVVRVLDANGNVDRDYAGTPSITTSDNEVKFTLANKNLTPSNGIISFNNSLTFTSTGNGIDGTTTFIKISDGVGGLSLPSLNSSNVTLSYSKTTDVVQTSSFTYPTDIPYIQYQEASNITVGSTSIVLDQFTVRDGGAVAPDADGTNTRLTGVALDITNWKNLRRLAIYDDLGNELQEQAINTTTVTAVSASVGRIAFTTFGSPFVVTDNSQRTFSIRASFIANGAVDNQVVSFKIFAVATPTTASSYFALTNPVNIASNVSGQQNQLEVTATQIDFTKFPTGISINVPINSPAVEIQARDLYANVDLDFTSPLSAFGNTDGLNMSNTPFTPDPISSFVDGVLTFSNNFLFINSNGNPNTKVYVQAGYINTDQFSPAFSVLASKESRIAKTIVSPNATIKYITLQATNIQSTDVDNVSGSAILAGYQLSDGNGITNDVDGASSKISTVTFDITTNGVAGAIGIRQIAIYDANGNELEEQTLGAQTSVTFGSGTPLGITAPDNGTTTFTIRASFNNTAALIQDKDLIQLQITNVTQPSGSSQFDQTTTSIANGTWNFTTGAVTGSNITSNSANKIDVIATRLDFTTQPASLLAGINQPFSPPEIKARDANAIIDLDYDISNPNPSYRRAAINTPAGGATLSITNWGFSQGVLTFPTIINGASIGGSLYYTKVGDGTLTITANGLSSDNGLSIPSSHIDVFDVTAKNIGKGVGGVVSSNSLKGGLKDAIIFGVTFSAPYITAAEPTLKGFSIVFSNPFKKLGSTVFKNFKVFESTNGNSVGSINITGFGGTITETQSDSLVAIGAPSTTLNRLQIDLPDRKLNDPDVKERSYFLSVEVDVTARNSTPKMIPFVVDKGYTTGSDGYVVTSSGSATAAVIGQQYRFASINPPKLISSYPKSGGLNFGVTKDTISITFDVPVVTFDGVAKLYKRSRNPLVAAQFVDTLKALNGKYLGTGLLTPYVTNTLFFKIPPGKLTADSVYYVTIDKGDFNAKTGISDDSFNFYGGISYSNTLYFKVESPNAPIMTATDRTKYYLSPYAASFNCTFDQKGMAYYMVVKTTDPTPTNAQVKGAAYSGTALQRGSFAIDQITPNYQTATFNHNLPAGTYNVWVCAENDAPTPVSTKTPYSFDSDKKTFDQVDPTKTDAPPTVTITIPAPTAIPRVYYNRPTISLCANSAVTVSDPIIVAEGAKADFSATGFQNFYIVLPTNFQFADINSLPTVTLSGTDFTGPATPTYLNNSLLNISFINNGNASFDVITISNLKLIATTTDVTGQIKRFAGNGLSAVPNNTVLATLISTTAASQLFTNSYTLLNKFSQKPLSITNAVTVVPDNFSDPGLDPLSIRLIPTVPSEDFGPSYFSGNGVTNDILSLTGLQLDNPFDITMTHTDMNGCISTKVDQYTVYDHTKAIPSLTSTAAKINNTIAVTTNTTQKDLSGKISIENLNFPSKSASILSTTITNMDELPGYKLDTLIANIPTDVPKDQIIKVTGTNTEWQKLVSQIPIVYETKGGYVNEKNDTIGRYRSYKVDYQYLLNANSLSQGKITEPYDNFIPNKSSLQGNTYYKGGSLGIIEFTGRYQSTADNTIFIPRRQRVEIFLPARPIVEVDQSIQPKKKIPTYCKDNGDIIINGYPAADGGKSSTGKFELYSKANVKLTLPANAFDDTGNGTAILRPSVFDNNFAPIVVKYTYQDNNSPAIGTGQLEITIEPNPVAAFTIKSLDPTGSALTGCDGVPVAFISTSTVANGSIKKYDWDFVDAKALKVDQTKSDSLLSTATHTYSLTNPYNPTLYVTSAVGCKSTKLATKTINIGVIPKPSFTFTGVSLNDSFEFTNGTTIAPASVNDGIYSLDWNFGDGAVSSTTSAKSNHLYKVPNDGTSNRKYDATLKVTSNLGCTNSISLPVIVLPYEDLSSSPKTYTFETDEKWQALPIVGSSWKRGTPIDIAPKTTGATSNRVWKTELTGGYSKNDNSYLYSPTFKVSSLKKPLISFNSWWEFSGQDGAVLQYSTDSKNILDTTKVWIALGRFDPLTKIATGKDWFTDQGLTTKPGGQQTGQYGWSGTTGDKWKDSRHSLFSDLNGISPSTSASVVFRFAFTSGQNSAVTTQKGFALDDFSIGERTRLVVVESFSNLGNKSAEEKAESDLLKSLTEINNKTGAFASRDILNINYHVAFPNKDPFNLDNPDDPSARALFYNISTSPRSRVDGADGSSTPTDLFSKWKNYFTLQQLKLAGATIQLDAQVVPDPDPNQKDSEIVIIPVKANALVKLDAANTVLMVGILEKVVSLSNPKVVASGVVAPENVGQLNSEFVLKKLLNTAAGTKLDVTLDPATATATKDFGTFKWKPDLTKLYPDASNELYAFAFLQNVDTKEIYQSEYVKISKYPSIVTGLETVTSEDVVVFPNPARQEFTVELPYVTTQRVNYQLIDQVGTVVSSGGIGEGQRSAKITTEDFTNGIYILQLKGEAEKVIRKKVLIVKE